MQQRKTIDFKRSIKVLATQMDWHVEIADNKGPNERLIIYARENGELHRIATIILRTDQKEISPSVARHIINGLTTRIAVELAKAADEPARSAVEKLIDWLKTWFG